MKTKTHLFLYIGSGVILGLVLIPILVFNVWLSDNNGSTFNYVNYRSTEMLYFNGNYSGFEHLREGDQITYSVQSDRAPISFGIWDRMFEKLPVKIVYGGNYFQISLESNKYDYYSLFLKPESSLFYNFTVLSGNAICFFIANASSLYDWSQGVESDFYYQINETLGDFGNFSNIPKSQDYFLVWFNENLTTSIVNCVINYTATNVYDFSVVDVAYEKVFLVPQGIFTVPFGQSGNWSFFIYFDPLFSLEEQTAITYHITYKIQVN